MTVKEMGAGGVIHDRPFSVRLGLRMDYRIDANGRGIRFRLTDTELRAAQGLANEVGTSLHAFIAEMLFAPVIAAKVEPEKWLQNQSQHLTARDESDPHYGR